MYCSKCGKVIADSETVCQNCGTHASESRPVKVSPKSRTVAAILAFFLGFLGIHRFYVGKIGTGIAIILTSWCIIGEVWALIDLIVILCGNFKDKDGLPITDWDAKY